MKIETYKEPKSSFLSLDKDMAIIVDKIFQNERLKKLLYYTTPDCLTQKALTNEQTNKMFGKEIKITPKVLIDDEIMNYLIINFDDFEPNNTNPEFRDNLIIIDILCHFDQWHLSDFQLRPYRIAGEIDSMFNNQKFSGIGTLLFVSGHKTVVNNEYAGLTLFYKAVHGVEDQINPLTPID